jgi:indole-3-glycerol phosphate synthase
MGDFLSQMEQGSIRRVPAAKNTSVSTPETRRSIPSVPAGIIAEIKPCSPTEGALTHAEASALVERARAYELGGAVALSVLTEPTVFGGDLSLMKTLAKAVSIPVMRKDFLVHPAQIDESSAFGARGVLLIGRLLSPDTLTEMIRRAHELGLFTLVEFFDAQDLENGLSVLDHAPPSMIGVNARDLSSLQVRPDIHERLHPLLPVGLSTVAESGVRTADHARNLFHHGYTHALVGTALMRSREPQALVRRLTAAFRPEGFIQ